MFVLTDAVFLSEQRIEQHVISLRGKENWEPKTEDFPQQNTKNKQTKKLIIIIRVIYINISDKILWKKLKPFLTLSKSMYKLSSTRKTCIGTKLCFAPIYATELSILKTFFVI